MRYLSVCSGIEAASVAWHHLGWQPVGFSEIEPFPSAVLAHHYPNVPNYGDMTKHEQWPIGPGSVDLLVGGTPCQSFSVAGLRKGLHDPRGGLMLTYLEIARRVRPRWVVWENVPGVLSSNGGRDFGSFLGALGELGYGWAYRVLDAQWVRTQRHPRAVPQRRRRVFVVGCLGDGAAAAAVLFERESVCRDSASRRASREGAPADAEAGVGAGCYWDGSDCAGTLTKQNANGGQRMPDKDNFGAVLQAVTVRSGSIGEFVQDDVGETMRATGGDCQGGSESLVLQPVASTLGNRGLRSHTELDGHGAYIPVQPVPYDLFQITAPVNRQNRAPGDPCHTLARDNAAHAAVAHAFYSTDGTHGVNQQPEVSPAVKVGSGLGIPSPPAVAQAMTVRRLTPRECERLQGFPDDWTMIPWRKKTAEECPDGPRYRALGNSMAVNVMAYIGERIAGVEARSAGNP